MNLLDKFSTVKVDNTTRIDSTLYEMLIKRQNICDEKHREYVNQINYMESYKTDSKKHPFKDFIETVKDNSSSMYYTFASNCFSDINDFYDLRVQFRDYPYRNNEVISLSEIIDYFFTETNGVDLTESGKQRIKDMMFNRFNERWKKPLPSITKSGTITLPSVVFIDTYWTSRSDALKIDYSDEMYIEMLIKSIDLYFNNTINDNGVLDDFKTTDRHYFKKGKTEINKNGIESITLFQNGNIKLKFIDKVDALKYYEFYNLHNCKEHN